MRVCPRCLRLLLSRASARCNWCGETIDDAVYQADAQKEREAFFTHQAEHDTQSLAATSAINVSAYDPFGLSGDPLMPPLNSRRTPPKTGRSQAERDGRTVTEIARETTHGSAASAPDDSREDEHASQGRFHHLEL